MSQRSEQLTKLLTVREDNYNTLTHTVAVLLAPTVLAGVFEILQLTTQDVTVHDIYIMDDMLVVDVSATYHDIDLIPKLINELAAFSGIDDDPNEIIRIMKIVLPVNIVFNDPSYIAQYINERLRHQIEYEQTGHNDLVQATQSEEPPLPIGYNQFDWSTLSSDQINNLHKPKGTKH